MVKTTMTFEGVQYAIKASVADSDSFYYDVDVNSTNVFFTGHYEIGCEFTHSRGTLAPDVSFKEALEDHLWEALKRGES